MKKNFYCLHSDLCKTLSNPKRQEILDTLRDREMSVTELTEKTRISQANLSQHLAILRAKRLVVARREGLNVHYTISNPKIIKAFDLISEVLQEALAQQNKTIGTAFRRKA